MWFKDADAFLMLAEKFRQSMKAAEIAPKKSDRYTHHRQMDAYLEAGAIVLLERESKGGKPAFLKTREHVAALFNEALKQNLVSNP